MRYAVAVQTDLAKSCSSACQAGDGKSIDEVREDMLRIFASERKIYLDEMKWRKREIDSREKEISRRESCGGYVKELETKLEESEIRLGQLDKKNIELSVESEQWKTEYGNLNMQLIELREKFKFYSNIIQEMSQ